MVTQLQPDTKRVFVVSGSSAFDQDAIEDLARAQFRAFDGRFEFTYWSGLPMKELLERVVGSPARLDPVSAHDHAGPQRAAVPAVRPDSSASRLSRTCPSTHGAHHKWVAAWSAAACTTRRSLAAPLAELVIRVLGGEKPENIPVAPVDLNVSEVDWRQLRRWGISEARVPAGTTVQVSRARFVGTLSVLHHRHGSSCSCYRRR